MRKINKKEKKREVCTIFESSLSMQQQHEFKALNIENTIANKQKKGFLIFLYSRKAMRSPNMRH